jgi:hypothetical protein
MRYFDKSAVNAQIPREGPRACPIVIPFTNTDTEFQVNLLLTQARLFMSLVATIYVDNSLNSAQLTIKTSVVNQVMIIPAYAFAYLPIMVPKNAMLDLSSSGAVNVGLDLINVPIPACVWQSGNAPPAANLIALEAGGGVIDLESGLGSIQLE